MKDKDTPDDMNALWNCQNPNQDQRQYSTVLCVCSAGLLRSPTLAYVMQNMGYNTRAAGVYDYALVRVNRVLLTWAEHVICVEKEHADYIIQHFPDFADKVIHLAVPDRFPYRAKILQEIIKQQLQEKGYE